MFLRSFRNSRQRTMRHTPFYPDNSKVIVITDESHRSQYHTFALNMRTALRNAAFIAFTGTPLITNEVGENTAGFRGICFKVQF